MSDNRECSIAGDAFSVVAHSTPFVKLVWKAGTKRLSKDKILKRLYDGKEQLHLAGLVLKDPMCQTILSLEEFRELTQEFAELRGQGLRLQRVLQTLKKRQVIKRYKTWVEITAWQQGSLQHKHNVWSKSDWASIGINIDDAIVTGSGGENGADTGTVVSASPSQATLVVVIEEGDDNDTNNSNDSDDAYEADDAGSLDSPTAPILDTSLFCVYKLYVAPLTNYCLRVSRTA
ncbi:hypothetical protein BV20DRAFT_1126327, partial [Pilatotrama ljubarskyi]